MKLYKSLNQPLPDQESPLELSQHYKDVCDLWKHFTRLKQLSYRLPPKKDTVSHPVIEWNMGRALILYGPSFTATGWTGRKMLPSIKCDPNFMFYAKILHSGHC